MTWKNTKDELPPTDKLVWVWNGNKEDIPILCARKNMIKISSNFGEVNQWEWEWFFKGSFHEGHVANKEKIKFWHSFKIPKFPD